MEKVAAAILSGAPARIEPRYYVLEDLRDLSLPFPLLRQTRVETLVRHRD
jgi:hypothetical protein